MASNKRKGSYEVIDEFSPVFALVIDKIKEIKATIETKKRIKISTLVAAPNKQPECKYGMYCFQVNPTHLKNYAHPDNTTYLLNIKTNIDFYAVDMNDLLELIYKVYKSDINLFDNEWGSIARNYLKGATMPIPVAQSQQRFFPENTIYFFLLATLHNNMPTYAAMVDGNDYRQFLIILLMRMEESATTGLYQMTPREYTTLFTHRIISEPGTNINGVNIEPSKFVSLANTSLVTGLQILRDKLPRGESLVGGRKRKSIRRTRRRATVRRAKRCK